MASYSSSSRPNYWIPNFVQYFPGYNDPVYVKPRIVEFSNLERNLFFV